VIGYHVGPGCALPLPVVRAVAQAEARVAEEAWVAELDRVDCWRGATLRLNLREGGYGAHLRLVVRRTAFHRAGLYEDGSGWVRAPGGGTVRVSVVA
jgi:hypothetical protein